MLQISKQVDYSIQLLLRLKSLEKEEFLSLKKFSDEKKISFLFLQRLAGILKNNGLIKSKRGSQGGYFLSPDLKNISLKKIIEVMDGGFGLCDCLRKKNCTCGREKTCAGKTFLEPVNEEIIAVLEKTIII
ncbi:MAG: Rrf2 family transcriptional regulator [Patescibacteria group bacterium]